jgi:Domain of unknown function (DUF3850)
MKSHKLHNLKIAPVYFEPVRDKIKTWEIRKNDREFAVGDILHLKEYDQENNEFTGRGCYRNVTHIHHGPGYGLAEGYCIMSII